MFKVRLASWFLLMLGGLTCTPIAAQEIAQADRAAIAARVVAFDAMMGEGRLGDVLDFMPPRLMRALAENAGMSEGELKAVLAAHAVEAFKTVRPISFGMDLHAATAGATPQQHRAYMLIPTQITMELPNGRRIQSRSNTLALNDDGQWYLVRIDNLEQVVLLRETYPEFVGVEFPSGSTSAVD